MFRFSNEVEPFTTDIKITPAVGILVGIKNILPERAKLTLNQYLIKSSYQSAYNGSVVNLDNVIKVLSKGCRFLDFEIFATTESRPYIAYSQDPNFQVIFGSNPTNLLMLDDILRFIMINGFSFTSPCPDDPLFIQLRIKSFDNNIYNNVARVIYNILSPKMLKDSNDNAVVITKDTPINTLLGKIIVVIDKSINPQYKNYSTCPTTTAPTGGGGGARCISIQDVTNIESGGSEWRQTTIVSTQLLEPNILKKPILDDSTDGMGIIVTDNSPVELTMVLPEKVSKTTVNMNKTLLSEYVSNYGFQTFPFLFFQTDTHLEFYENIFENYHTSFVPMGLAITYLTS